MKGRRVIAAAVAIFLSVPVSPAVGRAVAPTWTAGVGVSLVDTATDGTGATVVTGTVEVEGRERFLVAAFAPDGTERWRDTYQPIPDETSGTSGVAVTIDPEGRAYAVGFGWHCRYGCESGFWFLRAYTRAGGLRWTVGGGGWQRPRQWRATDVDAWAQGVAVSGFDYDDYVGPTDSWVRSYRFDGSLRWARPVGIPGRSDLRHTANAVAASGDGSVVVAGSLEPDAPMVVERDEEPFVQMLSPTGAPRWARVFREAGDLDEDAALAVDLRGTALVVAGVLGHPIGYGTPGPHLGWLAGLSRSGDLGWMRTWGTENPQDVRDVAIAPSGRILTVGGVRTSDRSYALTLRTHSSAGRLVSSWGVNPVASSLMGWAVSADASGASVVGTFYDSPYLERPGIGGRVWRLGQAPI